MENGANGLKVLVVDDEELIRELLVEALEPFDDIGEIIEAGDGKEALEIFKEKEIDLIVTDVRMPKVSGEELIECLEDFCFKVPMLVITGHGDKDMAIRLLRFGAFDFLEKPFDSEVLEERIGRAIDKRKKTLLELNDIDKKLVEQGLISSVEDFHQLSYKERVDLIKKASSL